MLKRVKITPILPLSSYLVASSCRNLSLLKVSWIFRLLNGWFSDRKLLQPAGKSFGGLTVDRLEQGTECALADGHDTKSLYCFDNIGFGFRLRRGTRPTNTSRKVEKA